jgi:predicted transcriptional regulator
MRTTVRLDDDILEEAKRYALDRGTTLTAVLEEALRELLARRGQRAAGAEPPLLPTFRGRGLRPGVDLHDTDALLDALEVAEDAGP